MLTLRLKPRPRPGALAQDFAPRAYWKMPWAGPWGSTESEGASRTLPLGLGNMGASENDLGR